MTMLSEEQLKRKHSEETQALHDEIIDKDRALNEYRKEHGRLEVFFNRIVSHIEPVIPLKSLYEKTYRSKKKTHSFIIPVAQVSDSHMGAVQQADEIEYFNEFDPDICKNRNLGFALGVTDWVNLHRNVYPIKELRMIYTGDLISGDIHDELRVTNAFPITEQAYQAALVHVQQIALLAPFFETIMVDFITEDNHSRLTKKPQAKEAGLNSMGYLIARLMEAYLKRHENVIFNIHTMHEKVISIGNLNYLVSHFHGVRAWMGIPWYGIERRVARESTARQSLIMQDLKLAKDIGFNKMIGGHFHTPFNSQLYSCAGSVSGTDAYDHQNGRHAEPSQPAWFIHPKWGEFNRTDFWLKRYDNLKS